MRSQQFAFEKAKDISLVKYKKDGKTFEVLVKPNSVIAFREGKLTLDKTIFAEEIYSNYSKGERCKEKDLEETFTTEKNNNEILTKILNEGEYHLSTQERKEKVEQKRKQMLQYLHKTYIDPKTNICHPITRLETALDSVKYNVDPFMPAEKQVAAIYSKLVEKIPLKKSQIEANITLKNYQIGSCMGILLKYGKILSQDYNEDIQATIVTIEISPGDFERLMSDLNTATKGDFNMSIAGASVGSSSGSGSASSSSSSGGKKKKKK
ncbi:hypothetical protein ABK040_011091 [Willaertia magna]